MKLLEKLRIELEYATEPHKRAGLKKPNEDRLYFDTENQIFILLDGVTRVHSEYDRRPYESASGDIGDIFIRAASRYVREHMDAAEPEELLLGAIREANSAILDYRSCRSAKDWAFYPSTLGFIGFIEDNTLYYVGAGDCMAMLIRRGAKMIFATEWSLEAVDLKRVSKQERYDIYCNHPESKHSYTVFNGDGCVTEGLCCSFIDLCPGDTLIIASDGIANYLKYEKSALLLGQTPEEMISLSGEYDAPPYAEYADDKTLLKISFS